MSARNFHAPIKIQLMAVLIAFVGLCQLGADEPQEIVLFDGTSFEGWEGDTDSVWRIEDGQIVAGSLTSAAARNEFLATTTEYENFDLSVKYKITGTHRVNAGIQFRTRRIPNHHEVSGYQADIGSNVDGHLYDESRRNRMLAEPTSEAVAKAHEAIGKDGWNTYRVRAEGNRIRLWLNGIPTVDYREDDDEIARSGVIALQIHADMRAIIAYKDVVLTPLPNLKKKSRVGK